MWFWHEHEEAAETDPVEEVEKQSLNRDPSFLKCMQHVCIFSTSLFIKTK